MYEKFKQLIDAKGITVYRIAKDTEIPSSTFYDWKAGRYMPKIDKIKKMAAYLEVEVADITG